MKKKRSTALKIFLSIVGVLLLAILLLIVWAAWGKNLGEQVRHESFVVSNESESAKNASAVYFTSDISPEGLLAVYDALGVEATGNVAVKLSTGEAGGEYYLSPDLIADLVHKVGGTIVECNTAYGGSRGSTAVHMQTAADHGFTAIADVDIMDSEGQMSIPVANGKHLTEDIVGSHLADYDFVMVLSHFKGHQMGGFGGALKNISIGIASSEGKGLIHSAGAGNLLTGMMFTPQNDFLESMAEAAKAVSDYENNGENMLYISVMNNLSIDCDCESNPAAPDMHDIGILASTDPVALDQACVNLIYEAEDGASLVERIESRNGLLTLKHAEEIGLGSRTYYIVNIDGEETNEDSEASTMKLIIGNTELTADLAENSSTQALVEILQQRDLIIEMRDYGSMEKVGMIGQSLPTNDESITTEAGDLILYQGNAFVIYYAPNSWNFTRLGKIRDVTATELKNILGSGTVSVTLSIN